MFWELLRIIIISLQWLAATSEPGINQDVLINSMGEMAHKIILNNFGDAACVGVITEINSDIVDYIPKSLLRFHIHIGRKYSSILKLEESDTLDYASLNNGMLAFERLLIESLNAGCPIYVIQVSNPKAVIHCFARASRRAMFRANRQYLYLPVLQEKFTVHDITNKNADDIFAMKEMNYMPDLVVARIVLQNRDKGNEICASHRFKNFQNFGNRNYSKQRECTENNSSIIVGTVTSEFKIELRTHRFIGSVTSKNLLLDVWIPSSGDCSGKFLRSLDLFPDKTRDVKGKELTLVTWYYPPFIILDFSSDPPLYDGIEFRVVREFLQYINSTFRQVESSRVFAIHQLNFQASRNRAPALKFSTFPVAL
jgi:hypothetical protein